MVRRPGTERLIGREQERSAVAGVLRDVAAGRSAVLVVRGEPGIGKTTLLEHAADEAGDGRVEWVAGIESEMELPFSGLHQLVGPFLDRTGTLPRLQREALSGALGLASGAPPNRFLVALATLTLLAEVASEDPLLCIVDDAQWVDDESLRAIAAVARRLDAERIGMIFGLREPVRRRMPLERLPELHVGALDATAARTLVTSVAPARVPRRVVDRITTDCGGNPLALVTLAADRSVDELVESAQRLDPLPLSLRLEARYRRQVEALPPSAQALLLAAAADPTGDTELLWRAGERLGFGADATEAAGVRDLIDLGPPLVLRHPLMRSAIYHGAPASERARTHEALAEATDPSELDRRAWHRAAATTGTDEAVAAELTSAAERARVRGGATAAAAFLARAASLSPEPSGRAKRLLAAAEARWLAGSHGEAARLLHDALPDLDDPRLLAEARRVEALLDANRTFGVDTALTAIDRARSVDPADPRLVRTVLLGAMAANASEYDALVRLARVGLELSTGGGPDRDPDELLLDGLCLAFSGDIVGAAPLLREALRTLSLSGRAPVEVQTLYQMACIAAVFIGDIDAMRRWAEGLEGFGRDLGAPAFAYIGAVAGATADLRAGDLVSCLRRQTADVEFLRDALPAAVFLGDMYVHGWRGDEVRTRALAASQAEWMRAHGRVGFTPYLHFMLSVLENALGNHAAALEHATAATPAAFQNAELVLLELVEAATRCGHRSAALGATEELEVRAGVAGDALVHGHVARARALLATDADAEHLYLEAIALLEHAVAPLHVARTRLLYGEWLHGQQRTREARDQLRTAQEHFATMGAQGYATRAERGRVATGEKVRRRPVHAPGELTPQEERIARLAVDGATNSEIAAQMFLSSATVDYHLRKVYRKLGAPSRRHLQGLLAASGAP